jgi:hypothetical protein
MRQDSQLPPLQVLSALHLHLHLVLLLLPLRDWGLGPGTWRIYRARSGARCWSEGETGAAQGYGSIAVLLHVGGRPARRSVWLEQQSIGARLDGTN